MISSARNANKVLLVGWDAADWKVISPLMDEGKMPCVQRLVQQGTMANLETLQPAFLGERCDRPDGCSALIQLRLCPRIVRRPQRKNFRSRSHVRHHFGELLDDFRMLGGDVSLFSDVLGDVI